MTLSPLNRKLLRDTLAMKGQVIAIALVIGCGITTFVMFLSTLDSLQSTRAAFYERARFADVFAPLKRAPQTLEPRIAEIPGVMQVETRIVRDVNLDVPGLPEPAIGRLISLPDRREPRLNQLYLRSGRWPEPGSNRGEVLVGEAFAAAHGFQPGARVAAVINGRLQRLRIVGIVLSPEYIFQIRAGEVLPDDLRFGVFWMSQRELEAAFNMEGAFNDVSLALSPGASEAEAIVRLDRLLARYGGIGAYGREDQVSHLFLSSRIDTLRGMALIAPSIFLSVAAFMLNVVLGRVVATQREQIAALKAFGYGRWEIGAHYFKLVLLIVAVGTLLGTLAGAWLARDLTALYSRFYRFPYYQFHIDPRIVVLALAFSSAAGILGTWTAVRRAVVLPPAEAMRPEPPARYRPSLAERLGLGRLLSPAARMIFRQLERRPLKALLSTAGISLAVAVLILGAFSEDALNYLTDFQFSIVQRQDVSLVLVEPTASGVMHEIERLPGVLYAEPMRSVPARLRLGHRSRRTAVMGLVSEPELFRLVDKTHQPAVLPPDGIVLSDILADLLGARLWDRVTIEVLEGQRPVRDVPVTGIVSEFAGANAYMNLHALRRLMREGETVSGAFLTVDSLQVDRLYGQLKETPRVAGVTIKEASLRSFRENVAANLLYIRTFNIIFASIIAFGVVYNTARISLSERSRELASMRVLGFTRGEISFILLGELAALTLLAIPLGLVAGYFFAWLVTLVAETEMFRLPLVVAPSTYALAAVVTLVASLLSGLAVRRRLDRLDLVAVLKSSE